MDQFDDLNATGVPSIRCSYVTSPDSFPDRSEPSIPPYMPIPPAPATGCATFQERLLHQSSPYVVDTIRISGKNITLIWLTK